AALTALLQPSGNLHVGDPLPVIAAAGRDISGLVLNIPKPAEILAGRDITALTVQGKNLAVSDLTLIEAGRDLQNPLPGSLLSVGGPGEFAVLAGRAIDLGFSAGIQTTGTLLNPNLPVTGGASLTVMAGLGSKGADYAAFLDKIVEMSADDRARLVSFVATQS